MARRAGLAALVAAIAGWSVAPPAESRWLAGDLHVHTTYSHDSYGGPGDDNTGVEEAYTLGHSVSSQFALANARGLDYLAITDHEDVRSQSDPGFGAGGVIPVPGYEASYQGHAQMLGATSIYDAGGESAAELDAVAAALRGPPDAGAFQVNHPAEGSTDFPHDIDWSYGYEVRPDTVEVWNISRLYQPPFPSGSSNDDAVRYWEGWLDRGERVAATGGSDSHWLLTTPIQSVGQPTTWVFADEDLGSAGVLEGLRQRRTFISHLPPALGGPRLELLADGDRDGGFEAMIGDTVTPGARFSARVQGAPGALLRVIVDGGAEAFDPVRVSGADFRHDFELPPGTSWVRLDLLHEDFPEQRASVCDGLIGAETTYCRNRLAVLAMSSPIYIR